MSWYFLFLFLFPLPSPTLRLPLLPLSFALLVPLHLPLSISTSCSSTSLYYLTPGGLRQFRCFCGVLETKGSRGGLLPFLDRHLLTNTIITSTDTSAPLHPLD